MVIVLKTKYIVQYTLVHVVVLKILARKIHS